MASKKKLRRNFRRIAERNDKSYRETIEVFYGKGIEDINRSLVYSLHKKTGRHSNRY